METKQTKNKTSVFTVILIFLVTALIIFSTVFLILYLNSDYKNITANKLSYEVNVNESVELDLTLENVDEDEYDIVSLDTSIAVYNSDTNCVEGLSGGKVAIEITSTISGFNKIALEVTVCDGLTMDTATLIDSVEDLQEIGTTYPLQNHYKLVKNLDLAGVSFTPIGNDDANGFSGSFNFNNYTISNLTVNGDYANAGLFATLADSAYVFDLTLTNANVDSYSNVGALAGTNNGTVKNVNVVGANIITSKNSIAIAKVGGIVGVNTSSISKSSVTQAEILSVGYAGGIAGLQKTNKVNPASIRQSFAKANVIGELYVGGLVGYNEGAVISNSFVNKEVVNNVEYGVVAAMYPTTYVGGLAGGVNNAVYTDDANVVHKVDSTLINCYVATEFGSIGYNGAVAGYNYDEKLEILQFNKYLGIYYPNNLLNVSSAFASTNNPNNVSLLGIYGVAEADLQDASKFFSHQTVSLSDVYWDFDDVWTMEGSYPTLNKNANIVSNDFSNIVAGGGIYSVADLVNINNNLNATYVLKADLDLSLIPDWTSIGTKDNPFNGKLVSDINPATNTPFSISGLTMKDTENAGLFGYLGDKAKIANIVLNNVSFTGQIYNAGAIAYQNSGSIENCTVTNLSYNLATTPSVVTNNANITYVAGLVAENYGAIVNSSVQSSKIINTDLAINNLSLLCGLNAGTISNSNVIDSVLEAHNSEALVGGIAAENAGIVTECYIAGNTKLFANISNSTLGGLVGSQAGGAIIQYSFVECQLKGYNVGGIIGNNYGNVAECYTNATIEGKYVGGLAYSVGLGFIANSYSVSKLVGLDNSSVKCGFAYSVGYQDENNWGAVIKCFSASTFNDIGKNYYETQSRVRNNAIVTIIGTTLPRVAGYIENSIYDNEIANATVMTDNVINGIFTNDRCAPAIGLSTAECKGSNNFARFTQEGFNTAIWNFDAAAGYPTLVNVIAK